ncbi:MAG: AraC family transcriptional regulator [Desulfobacteraceae bacterium]|nr:AraC family transcriptional regulator [Desulfobacteraceae bacterium]
MENLKSEHSSHQSKELARLVGSIAKEDGLFETNWPGLGVSRISTPFPRQPVPYKPSLCIVVQGQKQIFLGNKEYIYNPFQYLIVPVALPLEMEISQASKEKPLLGLGLELDLTTISELLLDIDESLQPFLPLKQSKPALFISRTTSSLQDALIRLFRLLSNPTDLKILGPQIVREIIYRVLQGEQGGQLRNLVFRDSGSHRIAGLIGFLNDNYDKKLSIAEIASFAGMSDSTLHHKFRDVTNMSPLQYLKKIRLHHARTMMIDRGLNSSEAGFEVGYSNPSQFSREFKSMFGLAPRQLIKSMSAEQ